MHLLYILILIFFQSFLIFIYRHEISQFFKIIDFPNERKTHLKPTPSIGGLILFPVFLEVFFYIYIEKLISLKIFLIWVSLVIAYFFVGFLDDRTHINAKAKIFIFISLLIIIIPLDTSLIIQSLKFRDINTVIVLNQGSIFFTVLCIFFFNNALNFSDGANGISISISLISILYFLYVTHFNEFYLILSLSLLICLIPNIFSKFFIGNSGVNLLSIVIALIFLKEYSSNIIYFDEIILLILIPSIDALRVVIERIIKKKSPLAPDRTHLHHYMNNIFKAKYVFVPYTILTAMPIIFANFLLNTYITFLIFLFIYFFIIYKFRK